MLNPDKEQNIEILERLISKEGYTDIGWANDGKDFSGLNSDRITPIQIIDCSNYLHKGTHKVYVDHDNKEILHVDSSD